MKRIITMVCVLALALSSVAFNVSAAEPAAQPDSDFEFDYVPEGITKPTKEQIEKDYIFAGFTPESNDFLSTEMVTLASVRSVPVTEPCDQSWRDKYPTTWMWEANRTVTAADDMLTSRYSIQFYSVSQKYWQNDSSSWDTYAMVREAHLEWGLRDGAKIMFAFTDFMLYDGDSEIFGRVEDIGLPYLLITCYGFDENAMTARHEVGHSYNLTHCSASTNCVMAAGAALSKYNSICSTHNTQWNNNRTRY